VRRALGLLEVLEQRLRVGFAVGDHPRELPREVRIGAVEALHDEAGVGDVLGEDDRLGEPRAVGDLVAAEWDEDGTIPGAVEAQAIDASLACSAALRRSPLSTRRSRMRRSF